MFENDLIPVVANRNEPKIVLGGFQVGPFQEGREYDVPFWVAHDLEKAGIVHFREEDFLDVVKLHKLHWKERVQPASQLSQLPEKFYPKVRRYLLLLQSLSQRNPEKLKDYEKSARISRDIVNCRVGKIVSLASSSLLSDQALQRLTQEERSLYYSLQGAIEEWKTKILLCGEHEW
ncbi:MAG: DNA replication complex GINS family protein [Candidatus Bathyarchaeota archaeon]|jgi:hypothetical protein|nr:MAG: DNA replication complex GINS family protein [Candidatus Bathyarchaeota archaeon]